MYQHIWLVSSFQKKKHQVQLMFPIHSWMCGLHWRVVYPSDAAPLKKTSSFFLFPRSYQLPIVPYLGVGIHTHLPSQCWNFVCSESVQVSCLLSQLLWIQMFNCPAVSRKHHFCSHPPPMVLTCFLHPLSPWSLSPRWRGCDITVAFRAEYSAHSYSLNCESLY